MNIIIKDNLNHKVHLEEDYVRFYFPINSSQSSFYETITKIRFFCKKQEEIDLIVTSNLYELIENLQNIQDIYKLDFYSEMFKILISKYFNTNVEVQEFYYRRDHQVAYDYVIFNVELILK